MGKRVSDGKKKLSCCDQGIQKKKRSEEGQAAVIENIYLPRRQVIHADDRFEIICFNVGTRRSKLKTQKGRKKKPLISSTSRPFRSQFQ
jgi:hypothetical protein